jgi:S1-C subfamily serine protease
VRRAGGALVALLVALSAGAAGARARYGESVVALKVTYQEWDEDRPWAKQNPGSRSASAVVVKGPRLLTRAQIVADATLIQVERGGGAHLWPARVEHVDPEIDLALLAVDDPACFEGLAPARLARQVPTEGSVSSVRWSNRQLEVATSRVQRIEVLTNRYGNVDHAFLVVRTDVERGGWAEPVFDGGWLVGITAAQEGERAWVLPAEIVGGYLARARRPGGYPGFARLGVEWQENRDHSLTAYLGLPGEARGVLIRSVRRGTSACGVLRPRDVLLELDGHAIDAIGNYAHPRYGRLRFAQLAALREPGEEMAARVWRDGAARELTIPLRAYPSDMRLVPWRRDERPPPYLVAGGLVFRELDGPFLRTWGAKWKENAPLDLSITYQLYAHGQTDDRRRILVVSSVLPDRYNLGYHEIANVVVRSVNGHRVDSVAALVEALRRPEAGFHVIALHPNRQRAEIVLDAASFEAANERILAAYGLPASMRLRRGPLPPLGTPCE